MEDVEIEIKSEEESKVQHSESTKELPEQI